MFSITDHLKGERPGGVLSMEIAVALDITERPRLTRGTWWSADTMSVAPTWRTTSSVTGSLGPDHRQACFIA
jgi:hypothetical protein